MDEMELTLDIINPDEEGDCLIACREYPGFSCFGEDLASALRELQVALPAFMEVVADAGK